MKAKIEQDVALAEERLRLAMLTSDYETLDKLISPDLIFTNHLGQVFGKQQDIDLHKSGLLVFEKLAPSEIQINTKREISIVSVRMETAGIYGGARFAADLRYTRVWLFAGDGSWLVVAGHSSAIV